MEPDRTDWGVQEYADALNRAATPADLFKLVEEVNSKWTTADDLDASFVIVEAAGIEVRGVSCRTTARVAGSWHN